MAFAISNLSQTYVLHFCNNSVLPALIGWECLHKWWPFIWANWIENVSLQIEKSGQLRAVYAGSTLMSYLIDTVSFFPKGIFHKLFMWHFTVIIIFKKVTASHTPCIRLLVDISTVVSIEKWESKCRGKSNYNWSWRFIFHFHSRNSFKWMQSASLPSFPFDFIPHLVRTFRSRFWDEVR